MSFNKKLLDLKVGIAISTFTEEKTDNKRYNIINKSLISLNKIVKETKLNVYVIIVVDGKVPKKHQDILNKYNSIFNISTRPNNGGVARTKNTSIRLLLEQKIDIGFLADDDVLYKSECLEKYCNTILLGKIHHMCFFQLDEISC